MNKLKFLLITFSAIVFMIGFYSCIKDDHSVSFESKDEGTTTQTRGNGCPTSIDLQLSQAGFIRPGASCGNILVTLNGLIENLKNCKIIKAEFTFRAKKPPFDWAPVLGNHTYFHQTSLPQNLPYKQTFWANTLGVTIPNNVTPDVLGDGDSFVIETNNALGFVGANTLENGAVEVCVKITVDCLDCPEINVCKTFIVYCQ